MHIYIYMCVCVCMYIYIYIHIYICLHMCTSIYSHMASSFCSYVYNPAFRDVCMSVSMSICTYCVCHVRFISRLSFLQYLEMPCRYLFSMCAYHTSVCRIYPRLGAEFQGKKFVYLGPDRACGPTEVSSMNRHSDDLLANYDRKYVFFSLELGPLPRNISF
jgi:hypothetical protein